MNNMFKRAISAITSLLYIATCATTTFALDQTVSYDSTVDDDPINYRSVPVEVTRAEVYEVSLPKSITLAAEDSTASLTFDIEAVGDISSIHYVRVIPVSGVTLMNEDETVALDADLTQNKKRWDINEVAENSGENKTSSTISVDDLEPGTWTGYINYYVALDDGGIWTAATCTTPATCMGYDTNDNGVLDEDEKIDTPITKGTALGHTSSDGTHSFEMTCSRCRKVVYEVSTPEEFVEFANAVNSGNTFAGKTITLANDIDMWDITASTPWNPIGNSTATTFNGTFDGNEHSISGVQSITNFLFSNNAYTYACTGLFGVLGDSAVIQNLRFKDSAMTTSNTQYDVGNPTYFAASAFVGATSGTVTISNCHINNVTMTVKLGIPSGKGSALRCYVSGFVSVPKYGSYSLNIKNSSLYNTTITMDATGSGIASMEVRSYAYTGYNRSGETSVAVSNSYSKLTASAIASTEMTSAATFVASINSSTRATVSNTADSLSVDDLKSQTGVDTLNTGLDTAIWKLDLENKNGGYPLTF